MKNLYVYGANVKNVFGKASPLKQGYHIQPDAAFRTWYVYKHGSILPQESVILVLAEMQGHPETPRPWK